MTEFEEEALMLLRQIAASLAANPSKSAGSSKARSKPTTLNYQDYPAFCSFWAQFPLHKSKYPAFVVWQQIAATDVLLQQRIISAAAAYRNDPTRDPTKTKHPDRWLRDRRFEDDLELVIPTAPKTNPAYTKGTPEWDARVFAEEQAAIEAMA